MSLYLRVRDSQKDWLFIYSLAGKRRKQGLGSYPALTIDAARQAAKASRELVAKGIDPIANRQAEESALQARHTVNSLFELWCKRQAAKRKDGGAEAARSMMKDVLPYIGKLNAEDVKRHHIIAVLDRVVDRGAKVGANRLLQNLRQMFGFAIDRDIVEIDPTRALTKKKVGGEETERDRVLSEDELRQLARQLPEAGLGLPVQCAVWIVLATCCRIGELSQARWSDIDEEARTWTIPAEHAKNGSEHAVHLSEFAVSQFQQIRELSTSRVWVCAARDPARHIDTKAIQKLIRDRQRVEPMKGRTTKADSLVLSGGEWTSHDLRRTGATLMGELGVSSDVIDRCLNHKPPSKVTRIYQRHESLAERRQAFDLLGQRLEILARGKSRVVPMRKRA